jgi:hypothetical protein
MTGAPTARRLDEQIQVRAGWRPAVPAQQQSTSLPR